MIGPPLPSAFDAAVLKTVTCLLASATQTPEPPPDIVAHCPFNRPRIKVQIRQKGAGITLAGIQTIVVMVPAAMAAYCMPFFCKTLQDLLGLQVLIQIPSLAVTDHYSIRASGHVNGKWPLVKHPQLFEIERRLLRIKRVQVPIQRQPGNSIWHGRQMRCLQYIMRKKPQKTVHWQPIGTGNFQVRQRQIDK